ncbi:MAG: NPCBM/NEW2 domain-containing protein, partial [Bryobacterales bacterium]|nr:NPCBM/NEW2 domain-containing protein [Bryobacterales bacterium]
MTSITPLNDVADRAAPSRKLLRAASSIAVFTFAFVSIAAGQTGTGTGLKGEYFANTDLKAPVALTRTDPTVNFTWAMTAPVPSFAPDKFSVRWTGQIEAPVTGNYTFVTRSDDGIRLWVNKKLLIDHWSDHGADWDQAVPMNFTAGQKYDIQLEYYENKGNSLIQLYWSYPNQPEQVIPQTRLYPAAITLQPQPPPMTRRWVSDLNWISAMNGWGPVELDRSNGELAGKDGKTMSIGGRRYYSGLGVHSRSEIRYPLLDRFDMFRAIVGVDDEVGDRGSVVFEVWLDGQKKFTSPVMKGNMPGLAIEVPVENVREMRLVVLDGGDGIGYDHADWAEARLEGVESVKYLSSMSWMSATNGLGPVEKDRANGAGEAKDGEKIKLAGLTYSRGLGTYANAEIRYDLDQKYERFSSVIGIDDSVGNGGSAIFEVWADNARLYRSPTMRGNMPSELVSVMVTGRETLVLKVFDAGDGQTNDSASWADAQLLPRNTDGTPGNIPAAPTELDADAGNASVKLSWKASPGAASYQVFRGTTSTVENIPIASNVTGTTYTNNGLTNGTKYYYRLKAVNNFGASGYSSMVSATPVLVIPPPTAAPSNLTATPGNTAITLSWGAVQGATGYRVFRGTTSNGQSSTPVATVNGTTFNNTGLTNGTAYFYKVAAINAGGQGPMSAQASATPTTGLAAPTGLTATPGDRQITLTWNGVTGATGYRVFRGTTSNGQSATAITTANGTSFADT